MLTGKQIKANIAEHPVLTSGILVNLLPPEELHKRKQGSKTAFINKASIIVLVALIFLTSVTLTLRIAQNLELQDVQKGLARAETKVTNLKGKEEQIFILKERLTAIQNLLGGDEKRKSIFNLVVYLTPADVFFSEVSVDRSGNMALSLNSPSLSSIETLFSSLADKEKNTDLIAKIDLEGLSLGKDAVYHFSLKITPKN